MSQEACTIEFKRASIIVNRIRMPQPSDNAVSEVTEDSRINFREPGSKNAGVKKSGYTYSRSS